MISWENYEEYMIMHADGELEPAEEQELMAFVDAHPELKSELALYNLTRLPADETMVYAHKDTLLREEPATRIIAFSQWKRYAIAAGIVALLFISLFKYRETSNNRSELVKIDSIKVAPALQNNTPAPLAQTPEQNNPIAPTQKEKIPAPAHRVQNVAVAHDIKVKHSPHNIKAPQMQREVIAENNKNNPAVVPVKMETATVANMKLLADNKTEPVASLITIPMFEPKVNEEEPKKSFIDRLPIDESNKHQLKALARIATGAAKAKQQLNEQEITFRVEDKKLKISF